MLPVCFGGLDGELVCKGDAVPGDGLACWWLEHGTAVLNGEALSWLGWSVRNPAGCGCKHSPVANICHLSFYPGDWGTYCDAA